LQKQSSTSLFEALISRLARPKTPAHGNNKSI
jgi:hypothetical protein